MKVIYILPTNSIFAGDNLSVINLILGLRKYDVSPLVVVSKESSLTERLDTLNIPYNIINYTPTAYMPVCRTWNDYLRFPKNLITHFVHYYMSAIKLIPIIRRFKPDIIHSNTGSTMAGYLVCKYCSMPHVWHVREYLDLDFDVRLLISKRKHRRRLSEFGNHVIAITQGIFDYYNLSGKDRVIYNGVLREIDASFCSNKEKYFLFVGRLTEKKGVGQLIKAFINFASFDSQISLFLAGSPVDEKYFVGLTNTVRDCGLESRIVFLGDRTDIYDLMRKAIALIVPSVFEGFGRITAEAMFNGCLVIGNNSAGTKEILASDNLGILYNGHEELSNHLKSVANSGVDNFLPIIIRAQEHAVKFFSQERNAMEVYGYYSEILKNRIGR